MISRKVLDSLGFNPADRQQLDHVLAVVRGALTSDAVGAYLFGSAVLGGLHPESGLDILVAPRRLTALAEKQRIVHDLMATSGRKTSEGSLRHIELAIMVERQVKPWRYPPTLDFQYGD